MGKYTILHFNKSTLEHLLEDRQKFWRVEDFDGSTRHECDEMMKSASTVIKSYLGYSCLVASSFLIQPIITGQLPVFLYVPPGWYYFLFFSFFYLTPYIMASIWGVDTIFYSISTPVRVQLKLLAFKFKNLDLDSIRSDDDQSIRKVKEQMKELIDYHNFLIKSIATDI
jgi:hypothetical protein